MKAEWMGPFLFSLVAFLLLAAGLISWNERALSMSFFGLASGTAVAGLWWLSRLSRSKS